jgi:hypothetical protein
MHAVSMGYAIVEGYEKKCVLMYAGSFALILALYAWKWILLRNLRHRGISLSFFLVGVALSAPVASLLSCDWDNDQVRAISNYVGNPVVVLTVPTVSYAHDLTRRLKPDPKRFVLRTVCELAIAVPGWFFLWLLCEVCILGWVVI